MKWILSVIMCIIFFAMASASVEHIGTERTWDSLRSDLVLTIVSVKDKTCPILKIENRSDEDMEMDFSSCIITLKTKEGAIDELRPTPPIEKIKFGKNAYVVFRIKIESPELKMAEIITVQLSGEMSYKNKDRTFNLFTEKQLTTE